MKIVEEKNGKIFTKNDEEDIIGKKYIPLYKKINKLYKGDGLIMRETEDIVLKKLNIVERVFFKKKFIEIYKAGVKAGFNWNNRNVP